MADNKQNKRPNVPPLRFPEFTEPWENTKLGELTTKVGSGSTPKGGNSVYIDSGRCFVRSQNVGMGVLLLNDIAHIDEKTHYKQASTEIREKDVLLNITGASIGRTAVANKQIAGGNVNQHVCIIRPNDKLNSDFLCNYIQTRKIQNYINSLQTGGSREGLNFQQVRSFPINVPLVSEQTKISRLLSIIDYRIAIQSKLIEQLQSLMGGIMVAHYNKCKKQVVQIKELGDYFTVMNLSKDNLTDEGNDCVLYGELFTTYHCTISEIKSKTNLTTGLTFSQSNDLLFPSSTTVDAVSLIAPSAITVPNVVLGGDMFGLHVNERYSNVYLAFLFNYILKQRLAKYAQGSTIIHLHFNDICNAKIEVPNLTDQLTFVELSSKVQQKIATEISMLANLQALKSYLLQQMFI